MTPLPLRAASLRLVLRVLAVVAGSMAMVTLAAPPAGAHPLGNFSVNFSSEIRAEPNAVAVRVVLDAAEIPTVQAFPDSATGVDDKAASAYRTQQCTDIANGSELRLDGVRAPLSVLSSRVEFPAGAAGLPTTRLTCNLRTSGRLHPVDTTLSYRLTGQADRLGWREITATGDGVLLADSTVPTSSPSQVLTAYPEDLLASPLNVQEASMEIRPGSGHVAGAPVPGAPADPLTRGVDKLTAAYTDLIASHELTVAFGLLAFALSMVLGAMHAFAPGHGKALMAATLVGTEGSLRQALTIGLSVTVTHSIGVLLLGLALTFTSLIAPERIYPWLGLVSGLLLVTLGATLLRAAMGRHSHASGAATLEQEPAGVESAHHGNEHGHAHAHGVPHSHRPAPHSHGLFSHTHEPAQLGTRSLLAVGFTGGLVPSPSALLVLLGGIALGRAWFGMVLVVGYGLGMAAALVAVGMALVKGKNWLDRHSTRLTRTGHGRTLALTTRWLPAATSALVILIGLGVAARAASAI